MTIAYVELAATLQERREELAETYYFDLASTPSVAATTPPPPLPRGYHATLRPAPLAEAAFEVDIPSCPTSPHEREPSRQQQGGGRRSCLLRVHRGAPGKGEGEAPWPEDEIDPSLTGLVMLPYAADMPASPRRAATVEEAAVALPGGVAVRLVRRRGADPSRSFGGESEEEAWNDELGSGESLRCSDGRRRKLEVSEPPGRAEEVVEIDCWGRWAVEACGSDQMTALPSDAAVDGQQRPPGITDRAPTPGHVAREAPIMAIAKRLAAAAHLHADAVRLDSAGRCSDAVGLLRRSLSLLGPASPPEQLSPGSEIGAVALCRCHLLRMRINAALLKAAIDEGSLWVEALGAAQALEPTYQLVYPSVWPNLGLHWATLAKLELLAGRPNEALTHARAALGVLEVTHSVRGLLGVGSGPCVLEQVGLSLAEAESETRNLEKILS